MPPGCRLDKHLLETPPRQLAKRNDFLTAIVHSLQLIPLIGLVWLYRDARLR